MYTKIKSAVLDGMNALNVDVEVTPRFLLLHTLSHLLIRELESIAGYPAASLKERIYCSRDRKMSGVLIYTTVSDIVGSLGGIVESAEPKEFLSLMDSAFKHAMWCSLDPVCTEHEGQGPIGDVRTHDFGRDERADRRLRRGVRDGH